MKTIPAYQHEVFRLYWKGVLQPVGAFTKEAVKEYIIKDIRFNNADIAEYVITSNFGIYNVGDFIK